MSRNGDTPTLALNLPDEFIEAIAERVADLVIERMPQSPEPYLDVDAAAEHLACPSSRVYELVSARRIRVHREGRRLLFTREDLDAALDVTEIEDR